MADRFYRYEDLHRAGVTRHAIRTFLDRRSMTRVSRGVYAPGPDDQLRGLRALFTRLPDGVVLGLWSAAALYGLARPLRPADPVHVMVPAGVVRPRIGTVVCHETALEIGPPVLRHGIPCVPPQRCAVDIARRARRLDGIAVLDAALHRGLTTEADLAQEVLRHGGLRGVLRARELVGLADGRAENAQESHLRIMIIDGGLPAPEPQLVVYDDTGYPVHRLDLGYRERKVGLEYDGRSHLTMDRLAADRARMKLAGLRRLGHALLHRPRPVPQPRPGGSHRPYTPDLTHHGSGPRGTR